jgi:hypothetical protein
MGRFQFSSIDARAEEELDGFTVDFLIRVWTVVRGRDRYMGGVAESEECRKYMMCVYF